MLPQVQVGSNVCSKASQLVHEEHGWRREEGNGRGFLPSLLATEEARTRERLTEREEEKEKKGSEDRDRKVETEVGILENMKKRK